MQELTEDKIYQILEQKYPELLLDYVLLSCEHDYLGEETHKQAVITAISAFNHRKRVGNNLNPPHFYVKEENMHGIRYSIQDFFSDTESTWQILSEHCRARETPSHMTYWQAFSEPPYTIPYTKNDFHKINHLLFPVQFRNALEIYSWNADFSNYFDDGKEWWGTALWSIYDKFMQRFVIIGASLTD